MTDLSVYLQHHKKHIDHYLNECIAGLNAPERLKEAMLYSLQAGGKRIRPILLLATMEALGCDAKEGIPVACAIEMIHTYSLIHDDLPAMDDDDLRRGKPTNHKVYGEAMAILAGDALLTLSFEVVGGLNEKAISAQVKSEILTKMAAASGAEGMVGGQVADLEAEDKSLELEALEAIHLRKTGKLLGFSIEAGALLAGADSKQRQSLGRFSKHLGLAFQIQDDILDVEGDTAKMGKAAGSDQQNRKSTYPQLLTLDGAKQKLGNHLEEGKKALYEAKIRHGQLEEIADFIAERKL